MQICYSTIVGDLEKLSSLKCALRHLKPKAQNRSSTEVALDYKEALDEPLGSLCISPSRPEFESKHYRFITGEVSSAELGVPQ